MLLIGLGNKSKSKDSKSMGMGKEPEEDPAKEGRFSAMKALMKALDSGDASAADEALSLHYELCAEHKSESEEGDDY